MIPAAELPAMEGWLLRLVFDMRTNWAQLDEIAWALIQLDRTGVINPNDVRQVQAHAREIEAEIRGQLTEIRNRAKPMVERRKLGSMDASLNWRGREIETNRARLNEVFWMMTQLEREIA
jgi:hypothetical protein